jgi:hypothetical protein
MTTIFDSSPCCGRWHNHQAAKDFLQVFRSSRSSTKRFWSQWWS